MKGNCITCLYQGDNNVDVDGNGKVFCMVECKWKKEQDSCKKFVEYADLSKEIRAQYALAKGGNNSFSSVIRKNWYTMLATLIISFILFLLAVKFFDKYIF